MGKHRYAKTQSNWLHQKLNEELDAFSLLFYDELIDRNIIFTNKIMERSRNAKNLTHRTH